MAMIDVPITTFRSKMTCCHWFMKCDAPPWYSTLSAANPHEEPWHEFGHEFALQLVLPFVAMDERRLYVL